MPGAIEMHCRLSNDRRESAAFERPAKAGASTGASHRTEPRAKRKVRSVLCHTCQ